MQFRFLDVDLGQSVRLAHDLGLYAYDAYVLVCALNVRSPLLTLDSDLAASAVTAGASVLEVNP